MEKLQPVLKNYLWGGNKLTAMYGRDNGGDKVSESWELSIHNDGLSKTNNSTLKQFISENQNCLGKNLNDLPILIKYIDAKQKLSVQVHPNDEYAITNENDNGKTEMWYIVDCDKGAGIYCGFNKDTNKQEFLQKVNDGTVEDMLNFIPVKKGDCFLIEAGTVHAIGEGCVICEIQQNSNVTYRVFDYNRRGADGKLRQLHVDKAVEVINYNKFKDNTHSGEIQKFKGGSIQVLTDCKYFCAKKLVLNGSYEQIDEKSFTAVNVLDGSGMINGQSFTAGDTFFVSCNEKLSLSGKATIILSTNSSLKYYAGLDLGGTFVKCGIVDEYGRVVVKDKVATNLDYNVTAKDMADLVLQLEKRANVKVESVGIGAPGTVDSKNGLILYSNNLNWRKVYLAKDVEKYTGLKTCISNDANVAALGEFAFGAGKKYNDVILVTLGTGVGGGVIIDGKLFEGNKSCGAELGHMVIKQNGEKCSCGRKGCLESYASTTALVRQAKVIMQKDGQSIMWQLCNGNIDNMNGVIFFDAYAKGDKSAKKVFNKYLTYLSCGLTNFANIFRPQAILLGGGISAVGDILTKPLQTKLNKEIFGGKSIAPVKILTAQLQNDAGILGAVKLAMMQN